MPNFLFPESQQSWEDNNPINILPVSSNVVNIALTGAKSELQKFFASPTALEKLDQVFDITDPSAAHILIENSAAGIFEQIPHLQIVNDAAINGAQGAFSKATNTIYLSDSLVRGDSLKVQEVLLEELGHKFDILLNPGGDTSGDEGELFKDVVLGLPLSQPELLRIQTENDFGTVVIDNQVIPVEQAQNSTDVTGDGKGDAIVANEDGVYVRRSNGNQFLPNEKWIDIPFWGTIGTAFADVTGDGKADAIASNNDGVYVRRSDASQFLPNEKWTDIGYWGTKGTWFADVTGDGKADAIVANDDGVYIRRSDGSQFLPNEKWTDIGYWGLHGTWFADVTGDGKADAIASNNEGVYIRRSDGSQFLPNEKWTDIGYWGSKATGFGDVTGDGKADAIVSNEDGVYVRRSNGSQFLPNEKWTDIGYWGSKGTWFGDVALSGRSLTLPPQNSTDVTGDGKGDAIVANEDGVYVRRSNGSQFLPNEKWIDIPFWGTIGTAFADVTGDGKADAIASNNDGVYVRRSDASQFLPNEKWTDIGYWGTKGTWFADVTGDGKADAIVANDDGVYIRRSDGSQFLPNEKWTDIGYWGLHGTWFADVTGDGKADAIASNNEGVYIRRSDGSQFLPNEKWTDIGYWGSKATGFGDVTGDGKADAIVSNEDGVYVRRSNGSQFLPNEKWTDIGYWGSKGTWFGDVALSGRSLTLPPPVWENPLALGSYTVSQEFGSGHTGIDLAGSTGTRIEAARSGNVVFVGTDQYGGKYIDIDHGGGLKTRYLHLSTFAVSVGDVVNDDTKIGEMGSTGLSTGPHLHFEVWQNGVRQNPRNYLSF